MPQQDVLESSATETATLRTFRSGPYLHRTLSGAATLLERRLSELEKAQISQRIKQARLEAGLTQEELADLLNVRQRTIANYESGRVPWRLIGRIAEITGRSAEWLLHGDGVATSAGEADRLDALAKEVGRMADLLEELAAALLPPKT